MIKNERQYRITKAQTEKFEGSLKQLITREQHASNIHPALQKAQIDALQSQLGDLRQELRDYEALRSGKRKMLAVESFDQLGRALIQARIATGLSQKDVGEKLGIKEQQIQRYEATEYQAASVGRIQEIIKALGLTVREDVFLPGANITTAALTKRLREVGFDKAFVQRRLLPRSTDLADDTAALTAATALGSVFHWLPSQIFENRSLKLDQSVLASARFKLAKGVNKGHIHAYTVYAHYLALLLLDAAPDLPPATIPEDASSFREAVVARYTKITLANVLRYVWDLGIPVLPLNDSGAFHGACWRVRGRNVIVLKQRTQSVARWLFDLLHEVWHAAQSPEEEDLGIVESEDGLLDDDEQIASCFAGDVLLKGKAEELAEECVAAAKGRMELLKSVVPTIAEKHNVSTPALANYMAFRLSLQNKNWWGAANNLQGAAQDPWLIARDIALERASLERINESDRHLLLNALT